MPILPKNNLSWSQINCFLTSPESYVKQYIYGEPFFETPYLKFGKKIADGLDGKIQDQETQEQIDFINGFFPSYKEREKKMEVTIEIDGESVKILGYYDAYEDGAIGEYKTGVQWDAKKVSKHGQLPMYAYLHHTRYGKLPKAIRLHWIQTHLVRGIVQLTGHLETFEVIPTQEDVNKIADMTEKAYRGIKALYQRELAKI